MVGILRTIIYSGLFILAVIPSDQLFLLAAQDGLMLGVPISVNSSTQVVDEQDSATKQAINLETNKEENVREEIHSSFEDVSETQEVPKVKNHLHSEPTIHFQQQHVNIATELSESGHAAVVYTLVDSATTELQQQAEISITAESENNTSRVTVPLRTVSDAPSQPPQNDTKYVVRAEPRQEPVPPTATASSDPGGTKEGEPAEMVEEVLTTANVTEETNDTVTQTVPTEPPQEDIPSFSEWAQKQLAEAEKKKGENMTGGGPLPPAPLKVRHSKNYASPDCGAKVVGANPEAVSAGAVLSSSRDEYLLNTCNARIWFIVELCEAIQPKKVEMANFELFSSSPKEFSIWLSDRYPTRDWVLAGRFTGQDERNVQSFNLSASAGAHFGKYVKVEVHSHYGQEHYCPVSLFRVYGTSEIEVLDTVDEGHHQASIDEDDDDIPLGEGGEVPKNLFGSARDAVLSIVKKAAEALAKSPEEGEGRGNNSSQTTKQTTRPSELCVTPSHITVCVNCSDDFYHKMYELLSCKGDMLSELLDSEFVRYAVANSQFCADRGLDLRVGAPYPTLPPHRPRPLDYLQAFLPSETLASLCNLLAVAQKKVVLNTSYEQESLDLSNETITVPVTVGPEEVTPVLPLTDSSCEVDGNLSGKPGLATRPPFEPPLSPPLPIRPSRTLRDDNGVTNESHAEVNVNVTQLPVETATTVPVPVENSSNITASVEKTAENLTLVVEDAGSLDSLFSELEQAVVPRKNPAPQKESVFVRLANRIKALERNMSLSGQYLEELSRRYKRQVEEMQKALVGAVEDRRRWEDKDTLRSEQLMHLTQQVEALTAAVKSLMEERDSWQHKATVVTQHGIIVVVEVVVFALVLYVCRWLPNVEVSSRKFSVAWSRNKNVNSTTRRKSVDEVLSQTQPQAKKRRPSEEALVIAGNTHKELLLPEAKRKISKGETRRQRKKKRRELVQQLEGDDRFPSLERNYVKSVTPWWEEEVFSPVLPLPPPPPCADVEVTTAPRFVQTAVAQRQERLARSSSENSDKGNKTFLPIKKTGPFKKIVKKFF